MHNKGGGGGGGGGQLPPWGIGVAIGAAVGVGMFVIFICAWLSTTVVNTWERTRGNKHSNSQRRGSDDFSVLLSQRLTGILFPPPAGNVLFFEVAPSPKDPSS